VLDNVDGSSSLAASQSTVVELLKGQTDTSATNGVHCGGGRGPRWLSPCHIFQS
jgi:hypothetical protein